MCVADRERDESGIEMKEKQMVNSVMRMCVDS